MKATESAAFGCLPHTDDWSSLRKSGTIGGKTVPNRIVYQAMEGCDGTAARIPDQLTQRGYQRFAKGGPGIIWVEVPVYLVGVAVSAVVGYGCIRLLKMIADKGKFGFFAYYCWAVGTLTLLLTILQN